MSELFDLCTQLSFYKSYHNNQVNLLIHAFFVPTILYSSLVILHEIPLAGGFTLAHALAALFGSYYVVLDVKVGALAAGILAYVVHGIDTGVIRISLKLATALFVTGWISQFIGHGVFERRRPALLDNLVQSLVAAPFLILFELLFCLGLYKQLQAKIKARAVSKEKVKT